MPQPITFNARPTITTVDTEIVFVFQKKGVLQSAKGKYDKLLTQLKKSKTFDGSFKSLRFVRFGGNGNVSNVLFVGLGDLKSLNYEKVRIAGALVQSKLSQEHCAEAAMSADFLSLSNGFSKADELTEFCQSFSEGMMLGAYKYKKHRTTLKKETNNFKKFIVTSKKKALKDKLQGALRDVHSTGEAVYLTRDWSNEPSNFGTPTYYANEARKLAKSHGLKCKILSEKDAKREKMGLFLGVSQGSDQEGKIVVLEYNPKKVKNPKTVALVGKGVTFDSGGISLKPSRSMEEMKHDMTGAATVMGAVLLAAKMKVKNKVVAIMAFTENMPNGKATQPGSVHVSRSGKTVEVVNTDAEGRLVLADVLDYAQDYKPDAIIDVATLTGAVIVGLGRYCCGILGNNDRLIQKIQDVGNENNERLWQLPLYDEYFDDMKSDYADMRNISTVPHAGTIMGAMFLKQFVKDSVPWVHLDIAATAWDMGYLPYYPKKGASGIYVRTLAKFIKEFK